jgi:nucleotide-binding universal stress UspA family protein
MVSIVAVGIDESATASKAVSMAAEVARRFDAQLVLLSAYKPSDAAAAAAGAADAERDWATSPGARQRETVARAEERFRREGVRCTSLAGEGHAADVLVRLAEECKADVLVVGSKGMQRRVLSSVPNAVTHKAPCSVLVVKTT